MPRDARTYITVADGMPDNRKIRVLSDKAFRTVVELWCWCSRELNDGRFDRDAFATFGTPAARKELIARGLVDDLGDGNYQAHDYLEHQRSREQIEALRRTRAEAGRKGGKAKATGLANAVADPGKSAAESESDTDRQDLTGSSSPAGGVLHRTDDDVSNSVDNSDARLPIAEVYDRVADRLAQISGVPVDRLTGATFADHILDRAPKEPRMQARYVITAINRDTIAAERFVHEGRLPE